MDAGAYIWSSDGTDQGTVPLIPAHAYPNLGPQTMLGTVGTHGYFALTTVRALVVVTGNSRD